MIIIVIIIIIIISEPAANMEKEKSSGRKVLDC